MNLRRSRSRFNYIGKREKPLTTLLKVHKRTACPHARYYSHKTVYFNCVHVNATLRVKATP